MTFARYTRSADLPRTELALRQAVTILSCLLRDADFIDSHIMPFLEKPAEDWYVAYREDSPDGSYSLQVFVWPPGSRTMIHDHSSWGAFSCVAGSVLEDRYERLDDGSLPDHARLKKLWQLEWRREDGISTVLPYDGGIHLVGNPAGEPAISVHLYGPRLGKIDGRDYDPSRDYVCDRPEDFTVTRTDDPSPGACTPDDCSLREAVIAANNQGGHDRILLSNRVYSLTRPISTTGDFGFAQMADLDVYDDLTIEGPTGGSAKSANRRQRRDDG